MVKYSGRKKAARAYAQANGISYTAARRTNQKGGLLSAFAVHTGLMEALEAAGWPVEYETFPEMVQYRGYAGPARLTIGRADQVRSFTGDDPDPDDGDMLDLSRPPMVDMACPLIPTRYEAGIELELTGDRTVGELVAALARMVADGRGRALGQLADVTPCGVCEDLYPAGHLLAIAAGRAEVPLCPACAFDGDVFDIDDYAAASLAYQIDRLASEDLAMPAGWTGPAALLACPAPAGFGDQLERWWREAGTLFVPADYWSHPELLWVWLPPGERPAPLDRFGPGASLGALVAALDEHMPDLRQRVRDRQAENWREAGATDDEPVPDEFLEPVWPAAVAYAISMHTQALERPDQRLPLWHALDSIDTLQEHMDLTESPLDFDDVESTLEVGALVITEALWPAGSS